ncbi:hypothetical protein [Salinadaptatus halalkaliphilus]|uniref:hypothetical protein n=1 Tax=Salinadaptatus halalkaliphilus TaxID=2419781 RepID=UPI001580BFB5|nr:hypothetical protein [Salinadaptatus halalkaliphilus]
MNAEPPADGEARGISRRTFVAPVAAMTAALEGERAVFVHSFSSDRNCRFGRTY